MERAAEPLVLLSVSSISPVLIPIMALVTLLSDFGLSDGYVAQMKAVILRICPEAVIVDISHGIEPHNIRMGSFVLETTAPLFPRGTIHVAVVDPRVGSIRRPLIIECDNGILVGPDNGILARTSSKLGFRAAFTIRPEPSRPISRTFHGRDLFAVAGAKLAKGDRPSVLGKKVSSIVKFKLERVRRSKKRIEASVLHVDRFGNIITNITDQEMFPIPPQPSEGFVLEVAGRRNPLVFAKTYLQIKRGNVAILKGSQGYYEIAARETSAARLLNVKAMDKLVVRSSLFYRSRKYHGGARRRQSS
jgi:S-adenosylmethionine hydrolase